MANRTGYLFDERFMWHNAGCLQSLSDFLQPTQHWEHPETKRRLHNLLHVSGLADDLQHLKPRSATFEELSRVHDEAYIRQVQALSQDDTKGHHTCGHAATFAPGGYEIAALAAGGAIAAMEAVLAGTVDNAYALVRPPGHHAERAAGAGFCIFNNIAVAAAHALAVHGLERVAVVDFDVHHGNGTQHMFEDDPRVLFISLHQDGNYPPDSGHAHEQGVGAGEGFTLNLPLPPGSGSGAYRAAFERVVTPALDAFRPQLVLVSCGFDASFQDPLAAMMCSSDEYRWMTEQLMQAAARHCAGRIVMLHEGGYSEVYVPFCGIAVLEQLSNVRTQVKDPFLSDVGGWGYKELQAHQDAVITKGEEAVQLLVSKMAGAAT